MPYRKRWKAFITPRPRQPRQNFQTEICRPKSTSQRNNSCPPAAPVSRYGLHRRVFDELRSSHMAFLYLLLSKTCPRLEFLGQMLVSVAEELLSLNTSSRIGFFWPAKQVSLIVQQYSSTVVRSSIIVVVQYSSTVQQGYISVQQYISRADHTV